MFPFSFLFFLIADAYPRLKSCHYNISNNISYVNAVFLCGLSRDYTAAILNNYNIHG